MRSMCTPVWITKEYMKNTNDSMMSDEDKRALEDLIGQQGTKKTEVSLETAKELSDWMEEDDRYNRNNPFLSSPDTLWIYTLYDILYPLPGSSRHRETFANIIINLSLRRESIFIGLHKSGYKDTYLPPYFLPSRVTEICNELQRRGYVILLKGYKLPGKAGVATIMEPTDKLLSLIPDMSYSIMEEGLVIPKEFSPDTFPPYALETRELLSKYNKTVGPENMLYATHKGSFEIDGRFTGSKVILMRKDDRKHIQIDGEATIELDIRNCLPFLLYANNLGEELPCDAYDIKGIPRKLAKEGFLRAMNCKTREKARRAVQSEINLNYRVLGINGAEVLNRLEGAHPALKEHFYSEVGRELMFLESRCMALFMRSMLDKGIKFYPIYDSVRVSLSKRDIAEEELKKSFTIGGIEPVIHED